jgi:hypothetical protein
MAHGSQVGRGQGCSASLALDSTHHDRRLYVTQRFGPAKSALSRTMAGRIGRRRGAEWDRLAPSDHLGLTGQPVPASGPTGLGEATDGDSIVMTPFTSNDQEPHRRFPGQSDLRDHARIRRRSQYELPGHSVHCTPLEPGVQHGDRLRENPSSHDDRPIVPCIWRYGVAATRLEVRLAWMYAAASERCSHQRGRKDSVIREHGASRGRSTTVWLRALAAQIARSARPRIDGVVGWLARGRH